MDEIFQTLNFEHTLTPPTLHNTPTHTNTKVNTPTKREWKEKNLFNKQRKRERERERIITFDFLFFFLVSKVAEEFLSHHTNLLLFDRHKKNTKQKQILC